MESFFRRSLIPSAIALFAAVSLVATGDVLTQFGLTQKSAGDLAVDAFTSGSVSVYQVRDKLKPASAEVRAAAVEQALVWTKAYVSSPAFKASYDRVRQERKPPAPEAKPTVDDEMKKLDADSRAQIAEMKKSIANLPPDQKKMAEDAMKTALAQMKQMSDNPEYQKARRQGIESERAEDNKRYSDAMSRWQRDFPANPRDLVVRRLKEFLAASANVDYGAKLVATYGTQHFANPAYEQKSADWKLCYRAGRLPVEKARAFAQAWLAELGAK